MPQLKLDIFILSIGARLQHLLLDMGILVRYSINAQFLLVNRN
jgi:hypothetical protein